MIIGTRGSKLARWQATWVASHLDQAGIAHETRVISTEGDQRTDVPLRTLSSTGLFTKALDDALLSGEVDIVVHSAKDMASTVPEGTEVLAFMKREDPRDALLANSEEIKLENLSRDLRIGTSSVRRQSLIRHFFPHIHLKELRGNVDTRLQKMENGDYDGIILALAGVKRMGMQSRVVQVLNPHTFTPAVGQGVVAVLCRKDWPDKDRLSSFLNHQETAWAIQAERAFLRKLGGGCSQPVFGHAQVWNGQVKLTCGKLLDQGNEMIRETGEEPVERAEWLGITLAEKVLLRINK